MTHLQILTFRKQGLMSLLQDSDISEEEYNEWRKYDVDSSISVKGMEELQEFSRPRVQHQAGKLRGLSFMLLFDEDINGTVCPIVDSFGYLVGYCKQINNTKKNTEIADQLAAIYFRLEFILLLKFLK